jgi:hypothetical protein
LVPDPLRWPDLTRQHLAGSEVTTGGQAANNWLIEVGTGSRSSSLLASRLMSLLYGVGAAYSGRVRDLAEPPGRRLLDPAGSSQPGRRAALRGLAVNRPLGTCLSQGHRPRVFPLPSQEEIAIRRGLSALRPASARETPSVSVPRQSRGLCDLEAAQRGLDPIGPLEVCRQRTKHPSPSHPFPLFPLPWGEGRGGGELG